MTQHTFTESLRQSAIKHLCAEIVGGALSPVVGEPPNPMTTAEALSASFEAGASLGPTFASEAVEVLERAQSEDGLWRDSSADPWIISSSAWCLWALAEPSLRTRTRPIVDRGLNGLLGCVLQDGSYPTRPGQKLGNTYASSYALRALARISPEAGAVTINYLGRAQNKDGGWGLFPGEPSESTLTAYVLHGLLDSRRVTSAGSSQIEASVAFLQSAQNHDGTWPSWLNETSSMEGTCFSLYTLLRAGHSLTPRDLAGIHRIVERCQEPRPWDISGKTQNWVAVSALLLSSVLGGDSNGH